ncbi:hypothetical protein CASFOL_005383 [Castilleja foliolosa]|uniref:FLZ-type domain-containing protein n=1 Tax=Castilleja foliolosa TaxID=1961234 RepID=A0ABD3E399_9LAMI
MADYGSAKSPKITCSRQLTSSFFNSPKLFTAFASKGYNETESILSPTSILDAKTLFSAIKIPSWPKPENKTSFEKLGSRGLVDALIDEKSESSLSKPSSRMVVSGSNLKIQVPCFVSPNESPKSPSDFGIKTRSSHLGLFSPVKSPFGSSSSGILSTLSASEMELSEDYTCVISYGRYPRTTHIFDDCIAESCCGVVKFSESRRESLSFSGRSMSYPSDRFLSFCYECKKNLGHGKDIYMYRGEKAFCSSDCRYGQMMLDEDE